MSRCIQNYPRRETNAKLAKGKGRAPSPGNPAAGEEENVLSAAAVSAAEGETIAERTSLSSSYVRGLEEKLEYHRKVIRLYQNLSSLAIHPKRTGDGAAAAVAEEEEEAVGGGGKGKGRGRKDVMTCTAVNHLHRRAVRFDLAIPQDEESEDFSYRATGNAHLLPEYMKASLPPFCFERILIGRVRKKWLGWVSCSSFLYNSDPSRRRNYTYQVYVGEKLPK